MQLCRLIPAIVAVFVLCVPAFGATVTYTHDDLGRVTSAAYDNGVTIKYSYDAAGNRTQQVTGATLTWSATATCPTNCWGGGLWTP